MRARITAVTPEAGYRLYLTFSDGSAGTVDLRDQIVGRGGVFGPLEQSDVFRQVRVERESGTVVWPNGVDLDPDVLYSLATGRPLPGSAGSAMDEPSPA
jgi:hypothetical protein